jgi:hypothetical protein
MKEGSVNEAKIDKYLSPERIKLLWLLLKKRGIDFAPQQVEPVDCAIDPKIEESEKRPRESDSRSDKRTTESD